MKYIVSLVLASTFTSILSYKYFSRDKFSLPKVGECYERVYLLNDKTVSRELRKIIRVNPKDKQDTITYVYNMLDEEGFEKGKWYYLELLCSESVNWFFASDMDFITVKKTNCPW